MSYYEIDFALPVCERSAMRKTLIEKMLDEEAGTGIGDDCARYRYNVDAYQNYIIFLKRPTQLNKGFDFTVNIDGLWFKKQRRYSNPSHQDIFDALNDCKTNYADHYDRVIDAIVKIYRCENIAFYEPIELTFHDYNDNEHPIEVILLAIKWLFMEQDCAYWNYSGRTMFYTALRERDLA
jgi:hypothetical protein